MEGTIINNNYSLQNILVFLICLGRLDGILYENSIVFAMLIGLSLLALVSNLSNHNILRSTYFKWQFCLLSFFLISLLWAYDVEQGIIILIAYFGRAILLLYIYSYLVKTGNLCFLCKSYIAASIITVLHFIMSFGLSGMILVRSDSLSVSQGWNANAMGAMCVIALFMLFFILYNSQVIRKSFLLLIIVFCFLLFILMTGSKTSFFLIFGTLLLSYFFRSKKKIHAIFVVTLGICFLYFLIMYIPFFYKIIGERIQDLLLGFSSLDPMSTDRTSSDNLRFYMLQYGWELFKDNIILGYGVGNFQALFGDVNNGVRMYAHNNIIELLVNVGVIGASIYYWLYYRIIKSSIRMTNHKYGILCVSFMIVLIFSEFGQVTYLVFCNQLIMCVFMYQIYMDIIHNKIIYKSYVS